VTVIDLYSPNRRGRGPAHDRRVVLGEVGFSNQRAQKGKYRHATNTPYDDAPQDERAHTGSPLVSWLAVTKPPLRTHKTNQMNNDSPKEAKEK